MPSSTQVSAPPSAVKWQLHKSAAWVLVADVLRPGSLHRAIPAPYALTSLSHATDVVEQAIMASLGRTGSVVDMRVVRIGLRSEEDQVQCRMVLLVAEECVAGSLSLVLIESVAGPCHLP